MASRGDGESPVNSGWLLVAFSLPGILLGVHASETVPVGLLFPRLTSVPIRPPWFNDTDSGQLPPVQTWANCDYFVKLKLQVVHLMDGMVIRAHQPAVGTSPQANKDQSYFLRSGWLFTCLTGCIGIER
jgi:hypothetical protein